MTNQDSAITKISYARVIKMGKSCNSRCRFCFELGHEYPSDIETLKKMVANRGDCDQVVFTGQEPTLLKELPELLEFCVETDYKVIQVVSNGRMMAYKKYAESLVRSGMTELLVCLHSHLPEVHDSITGSEKSFSQTVRGIANVIGFSNKYSPFFNVEVVAGIILNPENFQTLPEIVELLDRLAVKQVFFIAMKDHPSGQTFVPDDPAKYIMPAVEKARTLGMIPMVKGFENTAPGLAELAYEQYVLSNPVLRIEEEPG